MIGNLLSNIVVAVLVLSVIIVIHELGHFAVAKFFKIKVETFSVGFGPRLLGFRKGDTDYRISAFLLGGYVKMAGETPTDTITGEAYEFLSKPKWQRFLVAAAGPAMNVILAIALIMGLYLYGTVVRAVQPNSPAMAAGIKPGDEIINVNGIDLHNSGKTIQQAIQETTEKTFPITILRTENPTPVAEQPSLWDKLRRFFGRSHAVDATSFPLAAVNNSSTGQRKEIVLDVTPVLRDGRKMIGIDVPFPTVHVKLGLIGAFEKSVETNKENAVLIFQVIGRLIKREASLRQLDGPVGIVAVSGQAYEAGFATLLTFMAVISLNLGILNILPIPILDGGVILLLVIESLMGRDLSLRMKERIVQASFVFLLMLTVIVLYNDVVKLLPPAQPTP